MKNDRFFARTLKIEDAPSTPNFTHQTPAEINLLKMHLNQAESQLLVISDRCCLASDTHVFNGVESFPLLLRGPLVGLADFRARGTPPHVTAPSEQPLGGTRRTHRRPHVEVEDGFASGFRGPTVVVDNIPNLLGRTVDVSRNIPVVSIKRGLGAAIELI